MNVKRLALECMANYEEEEYADPWVVVGPRGIRKRFVYMPTPVIRIAGRDYSSRTHVASPTVQEREFESGTWRPRVAAQMMVLIAREQRVRKMSYPDCYYAVHSVKLNGIYEGVDGTRFYRVYWRAALIKPEPGDTWEWRNSL